VVRYEYEIDGGKHRSTCITRDERSVWFSTESEAKSFLQEMMNQKMAFASVLHPHKAVIMKGCSKERKEHFVVLVLAGVLLISTGYLMAMIG
jgi:KaiC/GvpD/RAD55 family RecA-like ATPase